MDYRDPGIGGRWSDQVKAWRAAGIKVGHYWFNGRSATPEQVAAAIVKETNGVKIGDKEMLWWDVESEGSMSHWSPAEVVAYATALNSAGIPFSRQGIYLSSSVTRAANWAPVRDLGLQLWVADYGRNDGTVSSKPLVGYWEVVNLFQFTSANVEALRGVYSGNLDVNISGASVWTVHALQRALNKLLGLNLFVDGDYGDATRAAVRKYQESTKGKLVVDGDPGFKTLTQLELDLAA